MIWDWGASPYWMLMRLVRDESHAVELLLDGNPASGPG